MNTCWCVLGQQIKSNLEHWDDLSPLQKQWAETMAKSHAKAVFRVSWYLARAKEEKR